MVRHTSDPPEPPMPAYLPIERVRDADHIAGTAGLARGPNTVQPRDFGHHSNL
jgi:hypothetical protein